jgi:HSP20 family protein
MLKKKSFFERLTGGMRMTDDEEVSEPIATATRPSISSINKVQTPVVKGMEADQEVSTPQEEEEGQLTVDVYETANEIVVQTMVAGVEPQNLSVTITHEMIIIRGKREAPRGIDDDKYITRELYWGAFSRTIEFPQEIEPDEAEAVEKHGLLVVKLPKINKQKQTVLKVKSF